MIRFSSRLIIAFTAFSIALCQEASETVWKLKGALLKVSSDNLAYEAKNFIPLSIKPQYITAICYDSHTHGRGPSAWEATEAVAGAREAAVVLAPAVPVVAAIHASKSTQHFLILHWSAPVEDYGTTLTVEADKGNYEALLRELQQRTGKTWINIPQRRKAIYSRFGDELKSVQKESPEIYLDIKQQSRIGNSLLDADRYEAVLHGNSAQGNLFLFVGEEKERSIVAIVQVSIRDERNKSVEAVAVYTTPAVTPPQVAEIQLPTRTLTITESQPYDYSPDCPSLP
jgi:hypothetical protein